MSASPDPGAASAVPPAASAPVVPVAPAALPAGGRGVRVLRNVVTNYGRTLISGLIGIALTRFLLHALGADQYGLWATIFALTGYFGLFDQGIRPSLVRYLSRDHARGDADGMRRTVSSALLLYAGVGAIVMALTVAAAAGLPLLLRHLDPARMPEARAVVLIAGASLAIGFPLGVFGAALSGLQRYDIANVIGTAVTVLRALLFVVVLKAGTGLVGLAWASLAMNLLGHGLSWLWVRRLVPGLEGRWAHVSRPQLKLLGAYSSFAVLGAVAERVNFQSDALVIAALLGTALVTPFSLATTLVDIPRTLVYGASFVLAPTASELDTRGEHDTLHAMVVAGARYSILLAWPVLFALIVFGSNALLTWVPPDRRAAAVQAAPILVLLAAPTLVSLPQATAASVLYGVSRHRGVVALSLATAIANLGLSLLWAKPYGLMGVALGTAVPLVLIGGIVMFVYTTRALRLSPARYLAEGWLKPALLTVAFVAPAVVVQRLWHPVGVLPLLAAVLGCWLVFALVAWRFGLPDAERRRWARMVRGLIGAPPAPAAKDASCA
ncbi:MAG TPA: oligosaccharide flippase family protein [Candidatus Eisenbacteria bacterium]|nr:oligosaccharide flippase family protein [Candidatus Eisenbacteria bacterium]